MLIAEELLLLSLDQGRGRHRLASSSLEPAVGGALLAELALRGRIDVTYRAGRFGRRLGRGVLTVISAEPVGHPVLDELLASLVEREGTPIIDLISPLKRKRVTRLLPRRLVGGLVQDGTLVEDRRRLVRLVPLRRWRCSEPERVAHLRDRLHQVTVDGWSPTDREAALASVLHASGLLTRVVRPVNRRAFRERMRTLADGEWAAKAVRDAIAEVATVLSVAATAGAAGAAGG